MSSYKLFWKLRFYLLKLQFFTLRKRISKSYFKKIDLHTTPMA